MRNKTIAAVALAVFATSGYANAGTESTAVGTGIAGADATAAIEQYSQGSVGLAGLPGGICSEGVTLGAFGAGIGSSQLNAACLVIETVPSNVHLGILTRAQGAALVIEAYSRLGFSFAQPARASTPMSVATPAFPNINGAWEDLVREQQRQIVKCEAKWNGQAVVACVGTPGYPDS